MNEGERGFTLVELLVAISILGLLTTLAAGLLHLSARSWNKVNELSENAATVEAVQSMLRQELARANPVSQGEIEFSGRESGIQFKAPLPIALGGNLADIQLRLDGKNLVMAWRQRSESEWKTSVVLSDIGDVHYFYYGAAQDTKSPGWQNIWVDRKTLPQAVKVTIDFPAKDSRQWPELVVAPIIAVDAGCIYDVTSKKCREK